jgi:hypothetical protein
MLVGITLATNFTGNDCLAVACEAVRVAVLSAVKLKALIAKVVEELPAATVTEAGTESKALLLARVTVLPPAGAAELKATVQAPLAPVARLAGVQERLVSVARGESVTAKPAEEPLSEALRVAVPAAVIEEAVAVKVVEETPEGTVTEAGTANAALLLASETRAPPTGAVRFRVTEQLEVPEPVMVEGVQLRAVSRAAGSRLTERPAEDPFKEALIVAVPAAVMVAAVALKVAEVEPAGTVTEAGRVSAGLLSASEITAPPAGAGAFRVTVQSVEPEPVMAPGAQVRAVNRMEGERLTAKPAVEPLSEALMVAVPAAVMAAAVAAKVVEVEPEGTVIEEGTASCALLLVRVTRAPP